MKNSPESGEFCCLHIYLFNNGKAIHFRTTLTPLRLLFLLYDITRTKQINPTDNCKAYYNCAIGLFCSCNLYF